MAVKVRVPDERGEPARNPGPGPAALREFFADPGSLRKAFGFAPRPDGGAVGEFHALSELRAASIRR